MRYAARIASHGSDGSFTVNWDDGDPTDRVKHPSEVWSSTSESATSLKVCLCSTCTCAIGQNVVATYNDGYDYPATIAHHASDGTITVNWDDGDMYDRFHQPSEVWLLSTDFKSCACGVGATNVDAPYLDGNLYSATIVDLRPDGTVEVDWNDGKTDGRVLNLWDVRPRNPDGTTLWHCAYPPNVASTATAQSTG